MATIQKGSKINFYKFVQVKETGKTSAVSSAINRNTSGVNNIGETVNGIAKSVKRINDIQVKRLELLQAENKKKFKPQYAKTDNKVAKGFLTKVSEGRAPGFLEGLLKMFSSLFKLFIVLPIMKWMADPKNKEAVETAVKVVSSIVKFMAAIAKFGVTNALDGLYGMLSEDTGWFEKVFRFGQAVLGIGTLVLGMKYLFRPDKLIRDIIGSVRALIAFATGGGRGMGMGRGRGRGRGLGRGRGRGLLGLGTRVVGSGLALWGVSELLFPQPVADGTLEGNQDALNLRPQQQEDPLKGVFGPNDKGFLGVENGQLTLIQTPKQNDQKDASSFNDFINNRSDLDLSSLDPNGEFAKLGDSVRDIDRTLQTILTKNELPDEFKPALKEFEDNLLNSDIARSLRDFSGIFEGLDNSDFLNNRKGWKESGGFSGILSAFGLGGKGGKQETVREKGGGGFLGGLGNLFGLGGKKEKTPPPKMQKITSKQDVSGRFDMKSGKAYINGKEVSTAEYMRFFNMSPKQKLDTYGGGTSGIENFLFKPKKEDKSGGFFGGLGNLFGGGKKKEPEKKSSGFFGGLGNLFGGGSKKKSNSGIQNFLNKPEKKKSSWWNPFSWGKKEYGRQIPKYELGGFVTGPDSGYNVDVGGKTIEAHGTEWIGTKSNQTGYVVPIDNKATRVNPHLTQERASEASRMGYGEVPGFFLGGLINKGKNFFSGFGKKKDTAGSKNQKSSGWLSGIGNIFGGGKEKKEEKKGGFLSGAKDWLGKTFGGGKKEENKSNIFGDILDRTKNFFGGKGWSLSLDEDKKEKTGNWLSNIIDGAKGMFGMGGGESADGGEATGPFAGLQNIFSGAKDWLGDTFGKITAIIPGMGATTIGDNTQQAQEGIAGWVNKTWSNLTSGGKEDTRSNTTDIGQSAEGGKPPTEEEIRVAAALSTEAGRGSSATDVLQVAANRVQHGGYGGTNLTDVFAAPGQFHGVFSRGSNKFKQIRSIEDAAEWAGTTPDVIQGYIRDTRNKTNRSRSNSFVSGALEFRAAPPYYKQNGLVQGEMSSDGRFYDSRWRGGRGDNQYLVGPQDTMIGAPAPVDLGGINTGGGGSVNSPSQTEASRMFGTSAGGKSTGGQTALISRGGGGGSEEQSGGGPQNVGSQSRKEKTNLDRMTQKRDAAREKIAKNSRNMIEAAMNQIQQMNLANQQTIQQAYATISQLQQQGRMNQPKFINAGGQATTQSPAMQINSLLNPMKKAS